MIQSIEPKRRLNSLRLHGYPQHMIIDESAVLGAGGGGGGVGVLPTSPPNRRPLPYPQSTCMRKRRVKQND